MADVQFRALLAGRRPANEVDGWGVEVEERWGSLRTVGGERAVPSSPGAYQDFYRQFALAVAGRGPLPVTAAEGVATLQVLDAARLSDREGRVVELA